MNVYKVMLWKAYFDKGYSTTHYVKYLIALFGISSLNVKFTLLLGLAYAISCLILGRLWYHFKIVNVEKEIENKFNPFVGEMREKFGVPNNLETFK